MPGAGWKLRKYGKSLREAAEWKRQFFAEDRFATVDELVAAAAHGGNAELYVAAFLELGHADRKRRPVSDLHEAIGQGHANNWSRKVCSGLWAVYCAERHMWKEEEREEPPEVTTATRAQRAQLRGLGLAATFRRRPLGKRAAEKRKEAERLIQTRAYVMWLDNYNKFRYSRNPNEERDRCINATVSALLPLREVDRHGWTGWPSAEQLQDALVAFPASMAQHHRTFADAVRNLIRDNLGYDHLRVPLDQRRFGVASMPWRPYRITASDIKSTEGLAQAVHEALVLRRQVMGLCCLLMDVNIYWRLLKLAYGFNHLEHNVRGCLHDCVPVMGVWHAYAHCCKKVYEHFLPWWCALEIPGFLKFPAQSMVWTKPKLVTIEHLVLGAFLARGQVEADVRRTLQRIATADPNMTSPRWEQCFGLLVLLTEYVPALVELGISVRQCFWATQEANTGLQARLVLRSALVLLQSLHGAGSTEYIRNLAVTDLLWSRVHTSLPAAAFIEECLESSLSVLARHAQTDTRSTTVDHFSDMYIQGPIQLL